MSEWFVDANTTVIFRSGQVRSDVGGRVGVWMCFSSTKNIENLGGSR